MGKYCTLVPDSYFNTYIGDICKIHDEDYDKATKTRLEADIDFKQRLQTRIGFIPAQIYYIGVRLFGWCRWNRK